MAASDFACEGGVCVGVCAAFRRRRWGCCHGEIRRRLRARFARPRRLFFCVDALTGKEVWKFQFPAPTKSALDYGNSPRATPLIADGRVFLLGAFGHLHCLALETGELIWTSNLASEFDAPRPIWGFAGSPLLVDGKLIVQPGAASAALVALDPENGDVIWETPGHKSAYAALLPVTLAGKTQVVGYDATTLGGWDIATGKRIWELKPEHAGDFNVPSAVLVGDKIFVATESNPARVLVFDSEGRALAKPVATFEKLAPDTHTPVLVGRHIVGLSEALYCLDAATLQPAWAVAEPGIGDYAALISDGKTRVLALGDNGMLALYSTTSSKPLGTLRISEEDAHLLAHPALVGNRLYMRIGQRLVCMSL